MRPCPADRRCRRIPLAGRMLGGYGAESAGLSHGGCTVRGDHSGVSEMICAALTLSCFQSSYFSRAASFVPDVTP